MNKHTFYSGLAALCMLASSAAFAQNGNHGNDNRGQGHAYGQRDKDHDDNGNHGRNDRYDYRPVANAHGGMRGAGPRHDMRRGGRLPSDYRSRQYVVNDWRGHHLSAPPRGQHWVQAGNDYVLVAIATGIIAQVLLNN